MTPTPLSNISVRQLANLLKKFHVNNGDVILIKYQSTIGKEEVVSGIATALGRMKVTDAIVVVVDNFEDLTVLNETEMRKHGWFRLDSLKKVTKK